MHHDGDEVEAVLEGLGLDQHPFEPAARATFSSCRGTPAFFSQTVKTR